MDKIIYFVRHGQTEANVKGTVQDLTDMLTPHGEMQAEKLAERATGIDFEALISSDATRAKKTAEIIAKKTGHAVEHSALFREIKRPTSLVGQRHEGEAYLKFRTEEEANLRNPDWHHEDEENFFDLRSRAEKAVKYIEDRPEKTLLVVSHGFFMRMITSYLLMEKDLSPDRWEHLSKTFLGENTGITVWFIEDGRWRMFIWNDHSHLADANT